VRLREAVQKSIHGNLVLYAERITGRVGDCRITRLRVPPPPPPLAQAQGVARLSK